MRMPRSILPLTAVALAGCAAGPPRLTDGAQTAELSFLVDNDSRHTTGRFIQIYSYSDLSCQNGQRLVNKWFVGDKKDFGPYKIEANRPLVFEIAYGETRFAQNRDCYVRGAFVPGQDKHYQIAYHSVEQVAQCGVEILEGTSGQYAKVEAEFPDQVCHKSPAGTQENGQPGYLQWSVRVH